jgi:hypothetical protein
VPSGPVFDDLLLQAHLVATAVTAGMVWVVQLVVYPGFRAVGPTAAWSAYHRRHTCAMAAVIALPWAVQGLTVALLLLRRTGPLVLLTAALAALTVLVTVVVSVPLHTRLGVAYDDALARRLIRTNWWRTAAWTAGTCCAAALAY